MWKGNECVWRKNNGFWLVWPLISLSDSLLSSWCMIKTLTANQNPFWFKELAHLKQQIANLHCLEQTERHRPLDSNIIITSYYSWCEPALEKNKQTKKKTTHCVHFPKLNILKHAISTCWHEKPFSGKSQAASGFFWLH